MPSTFINSRVFLSSQTCAVRKPEYHLNIPKGIQVTEWTRSFTSTPTPKGSVPKLICPHPYTFSVGEGEHNNMYIKRNLLQENVCVRACVHMSVWRKYNSMNSISSELLLHILLQFQTLYRIKFVFGQ